MSVRYQCALNKQKKKQTNKQAKTEQFFEECTGFCFLVNGSLNIKKICFCCCKFDHFLVNFIVILKFAEHNLPLVSSSP